MAPAATATEFSQRSLRDSGLHRFVAENTGRDPGDAWDFDSLSWVAFYYHPSLALARAQWATARAGEQVAGVRPNPTLTLTPGYNFTRQAGLSPWIPAINFDFLFPTNGKRQRAQDIARANAEAVRLGIFSAAWQVRGDLRRALADSSTASRRETLLRAQVDLQQKLLSLLEERRTAGSIGTAEVSLIRSALLRAESAAADALSQSLTARARVAAALAVPLAALDGVLLPSLPAAAILPPDAFEAARREALQSRPDVLAALAKYHAAHSALELEVAKRVPDFHLGPGYQWDQGANKWTLAISLELPLFHRNEAAIAEATARREEAAAQFRLVQAQVVAAIDVAVAAQTAASRQLEHAKRLQSELAHQNALVQQRVDVGGADQVDLQTAKLDLATVNTAILDAETAATLAAGLIEDALQLPFAHLAELAGASTAKITRSP